MLEEAVLASQKGQLITQPSSLEALFYLNC